MDRGRKWEDRKSGGPSTRGDFRDSPGTSGYMRRVQMRCHADAMFLLSRQWLNRASSHRNKDLKMPMNTAVRPRGDSVLEARIARSVAIQRYHERRLGCHCLSLQSRRKRANISLE
ncbi:hypothetical protein CI238_03065 [Colletotrichum incanum]|uniref:Uncharacterized protein n=1 Tax=Colletotrichum incanum TaxID=1573173 RepID=A0A166RBF0_COLIC|nr:hypothetical protein CI238_03065 [Colletotrichum incanum]